jgi:hypothetical protein|eukprot:TRINITY_DN23067_c0_g1_i1.p1 TRINITY_DN23067_c0_g1~~TRINITY_DN23067_c0_g1_i1.p1  ORF type:complete len:217 (-),score=54.75 TRINITY_DN23067_c0_g1_i1:195-845(-)
MRKATLLVCLFAVFLLNAMAFEMGSTESMDMDLDAFEDLDNDLEDMDNEELEDDVDMDEEADEEGSGKKDVALILSSLTSRPGDAKRWRIASFWGVVEPRKALMPEYKAQLKVWDKYAEKQVKSMDATEMNHSIGASPLKNDKYVPAWRMIFGSRNFPGWSPKDYFRKAMDLYAKNKDVCADATKADNCQINYKYDPETDKFTYVDVAIKSFNSKK